LKDGKTIWRTNFGTDWGATFFGDQKDVPEAKETASRRHGNNGSAIISGERVFVPVGSPDGASLVCFDKQTGSVIWKAGKDNSAYSSLMIASIGGVRQVVDLTADALMGVDADSGKVLWRTPVKTGAKRNILTPTISGDTVTLASTTVGMTKFQVSKEGANFKVQPGWRNDLLKVTIATPVLVGGHLYGVGTGIAKTDFVCTDFETGKILWSQPGFGDYASIIVVGDKLLVLNSTGELFLIKANPAKYEELGRLQICGKTWSHPAFVDGKYYVRDNRQLLAFELAR